MEMSVLGQLKELNLKQRSKMTEKEYVILTNYNTITSAIKHIRELSPSDDAGENGITPQKKAGLIIELESIQRRMFGLYGLPCTVTSIS